MSILEELTTQIKILPSPSDDPEDLILHSDAFPDQEENDEDEENGFGFSNGKGLSSSFSEENENSPNLNDNNSNNDNYEESSTASFHSTAAQSPQLDFDLLSPPDPFLSPQISNSNGMNLLPPSSQSLSLRGGHMRSVSQDSTFLIRKMNIMKLPQTTTNEAEDAKNTTPSSPSNAKSPQPPKKTTSRFFPSVFGSPQPPKKRTSLSKKEEEEEETDFAEMKISKTMQKELVKEALERKKQKQEKIVREEYIRSTIPIWEKEILPFWEKKKKDLKTIKLWKTGIPPKVRGQVWIKAVGNELRITRDLYSILKSKKISQNQPDEVVMKEEKKILTKEEELLSPTSEKSEINFPASPKANSKGGIVYNREGTINLIKVDLCRTFPALQFFQEGGPLYEPFKEVLECYVKFRPDMGYVQGMSYLVAVLLLNMEPYEAFVCLANMLNEQHFYNSYLMNPKYLEGNFLLFKTLMKEYLPKMHAHFEKEKISPSIFFVDWSLTLFSKSLPLDLASRIWDVYFLEGEVMIYKAILGLLKYFSKSLLEGDFETDMFLLSHLNKAKEGFDEKQIFDCIFSFETLTPKKFEQTRAKLNMNAGIEQ